MRQILSSASIAPKNYVAGENGFLILIFVSVQLGGKSETLKHYYCVDLQKKPGMLRGRSIWASVHKVCPVEVPVLTRLE